VSQRSRYLGCVLAACAVVLWFASVASAQRRAAQPNAADFRPEKFFESFLNGPANSEADLAKIKISAKEEQQIGEQQIEALKQQLLTRKLKLQTRGREVAYLATLVERLQPQMHEHKRYPKIRILYVEDEQPQAYAFCDGHLLISSGLLKAAQSEAALVCVLGHELSHLDRGHLLRRAKQWKLLQERFKDTSNFSPARLTASFDAMQAIFRRPFGPAEELEADTDGMTWAYELGYDPRAVAGIYDAVEQPGQKFLPAFLQSHPPSAERRENLQATYKALQEARPQEELYLGRENLQRRTAWDSPRK
jgi:predicted Zn-dependent protease